MDYDKPWHQLDIDITNAIRSDFDFYKMLSESQFANDPAGVWFFWAKEADRIFNMHWITELEKQGIPPLKNFMIFYREPFYIHPEAHIDVRRNGQPSIAAINWTLDPLDDSEMVWYNFPPNSSSEMVSSAGTTFRPWPMDQVKPYKITSKTIGTTPTLVRTGIPHNIIVSTRPRWVISVRYDDGHLSDWQETVEFFKPWIKNVNC